MPENRAIRGNVPAVVTPFTETGDLDQEALVRVLEWHIEQGADGICVAGDNGEAWALQSEDRRQLAEAAVRVAGGRVPVIMGASATTARQSIVLAEIAATVGVDALMVGPQAYVLKATTAELVARMETIHRAVPLPIVLYNSPRRTNISLTLESLGAIVDAVPVVGLKEATRDFFHLSHVIRRFGERLCVFVGPAPFILPGLALGAGGFISSGPELFRGAAAEVGRMALAAPDQTLRDLHDGFTRIYETLMGLGTWPAALKAALGLQGVPAGVPREPVQPLDAGGLATLRTVMEELRLLDEPAAIAGAA